VGDAAYVSRARAEFWGQRGRRLVAKRQIIETAHSQLESMGVQRLRARTRTGFWLKVVLSLLALVLLSFLPH
jgi:hypothetical protein